MAISGRKLPPEVSCESRGLSKLVPLRLRRRTLSRAGLRLRILANELTRIDWLSSDGQIDCSDNFYLSGSAPVEIPVLFILLAVAQIGSAQAQELQESVSVCTIRERPDLYLGKVVTVRANYTTDSIHYEYLTDTGCRYGTLDIGLRVPEREASVDAFKAARRTLCESEDKRYLCIVDGVVTVRGRIAEAPDAHLQPDATSLVINPFSVSDWEFKGGR